MTDTAWGTAGDFPLKTEMKGTKLLMARFYTDGVSAPKEINDPSGMLIITRVGVGVYQVDLPHKYVKVMAVADYQGGIPVLWARVTTIKQGSGSGLLPNGFRVRMETAAGVATETIDRPVQLFIGLTNVAGRVDEEG